MVRKVVFRGSTAQLSVKSRISAVLRHGQNAIRPLVVVFVRCGGEQSPPPFFLVNKSLKIVEIFTI